jgi:translocator assembly and maintenance protein 41
MSIENNHNDDIGTIKAIDEKLAEFESQPIDFKYYLHSLYKVQKNNKLPYKFGINQMHVSARELNSNMDEILTGILSRFKNPVDYAFGYGSKIFSQGSNVDISNSQIDIICAVHDPINWHKENIKNHSSDYSFLKYFGSNVVNSVGNLGAGIYYNPFVNIQIGNTALELKYGITSIDTLVDDLTNWRTLYLAGRLHKPVAIVKNNPQLMFLNQYNLANAVKLAILLIGESNISETELYMQIAGLSYMGDPRLKVKGENPDKVKNIVENQFELFQNLYRPILDNYFPNLIQNNGKSKSENKYLINLSKEQIGHILIELPREFRLILIENFIESRNTTINNDSLIDSMIGNDLIANDILTNAPGKLNLTEPKVSRTSYKELKSISSTASIDILSDIPSQDWEYLPTGYRFHNSPVFQEMAKFYYEDNNRFQEVLRKSIEQTVSSGALLQSVKGVLTAGLGRSWKYAMAKRRKYEQAQMKKNKGKGT